MKKLQAALLEFASENKYLTIVQKLSTVLALIYPIYAVLRKMTFLNFLTSPVSYFSTLLLYLYYAGTVMCIAENKLVALDIAYGLVALKHVLDLFSYGLSINRLTTIAAYAIILTICILETKKTDQWDNFAAKSLEKTSEVAKSVGNLVPKKENVENNVVCPHCGGLNDPDVKFCKACGKQIKD